MEEVKKESMKKGEKVSMKEAEKANPDISLLLGLQGIILTVLKGVVASKYIDDIWRPVLTVAIDKGLQAWQKRMDELEKELVDKEGHGQGRT